MSNFISLILDHQDVVVVRILDHIRGVVLVREVTAATHSVVEATLLHDIDASAQNEAQTIAVVGMTDEIQETSAEDEIVLAAEMTDFNEESLPTIDLIIIAASLEVLIVAARVHPTEETDLQTDAMRKSVATSGLKVTVSVVRI